MLLPTSTLLQTTLLPYSWFNWIYPGSPHQPLLSFSSPLLISTRTPLSRFSGVLLLSSASALCLLCLLCFLSAFFGLLSACFLPLPRPPPYNPLISIEILARGSRLLLAYSRRSICQRSFAFASKLHTTSTLRSTKSEKSGHSQHNHEHFAIRTITGLSDRHCVSTSLGFEDPSSY